ncbi:MAG: M23 family metallopeptidase [Gammaproteobacteria bacterium]
MGFDRKSGRHNVASDGSGSSEEHPSTSLRVARSVNASRRLAVFASKFLLIGMFAGCAASTTSASPTQTQTPLILSVQDAPIAFKGSDNHIHLVYELWVTNFSSVEITVSQVKVFGDGQVLQTLDARQVASRLQPAGQRSSIGIMESGTISLLFLHLTLPAGTPVPTKLSHEISFSARGRDEQFSENGGDITVDTKTKAPAVIGPPLMEANLVSADSCCDATRHTRAALPINGRVWIAQRYAVDWEQLDNQNRIYAGARDDVHSYTIYGDNVYAVANGKVVLAINDLPDEVPGVFPSGITLDEADGNSVILDIGNGNYALYAHLEPGSVTVHNGDTVTRGEIIGKVGNSGNTLAPHLHFQVMNGPLSLASNGLPYEISSFQITGISPGTEAFDEAEENGTPLDVTPVDPPTPATTALPLDQLIISFLPPPSGG